MSEQNTIQLILFKIFNAGIGFDARQIQNLQPYDASERNAVPIHQLLSINKESIEYSNPRYMTVRNNPALKIKIEDSFEMLTVSKNEIKPPPSLLRRHCRHLGLWGLYFWDEVGFALYDAALLVR